MMKPTYLGQNTPFITGMVQKKTPEEIAYAVKNLIVDGADALGIQLEFLPKEYKTEENYRRIFASCCGRPAYITNYRGRENQDLSDAELAESLLLALKSGATLGDVPGSLFDPDSRMGVGLELSEKREAVDAQMDLIERIHALGKESLISSHVCKFTDAETVLKIAFEQKRRGADVIKIVTAGNSVEEEMENLRITSLLKKELGAPFLFLSGGTHSRIHRMIGPQIGCVTYLAVKEYDGFAVPTQPTVKSAKAVRDNFNATPEIVE